MPTYNNKNFEIALKNVLEKEYVENKTYSKSTQYKHFLGKLTCICLEILNSSEATPEEAVYNALRISFHAGLLTGQQISLERKQKQ